MTKLPRPNVLMVDDTRTNLIIMRKVLAELDAELFEANSGEQALALCAEHEFAVILLDVQMEGMDGFTVARRLAKEKRSRATPIIFVTAVATDELSRIRGYGSGAVDYISKPFNNVVLVSKVQVFLELYRARQLLEREIEERKRQEERARHQATHDPLTGLPNRIVFVDRLESSIERVRRRGTSCALLYIDIDDFKPVNDRHGHAAGDALLKAIAQRLAEAMRKVDTVARLGGDEFAVVMDEPLTSQNALDKAEQVLAHLCEPYQLELEGRPNPLPVTVGASIGVALFPQHAKSLDDLVRLADDTMYRAKKTGKSMCLMAQA